MKSFGNSTNQGSKAAARLANFFGCIDLLQAYAATPDGKECGEAALMRDWYREEPGLCRMFQTFSDGLSFSICLNVCNMPPGFLG